MVGRNGKVGLSSESSLKLFDLKKSLKELRIKSEHDLVLKVDAYVPLLFLFRMD